MIGLGVAIGAAGVVAFVESRRFDPAPPAEVGANEWATPKPRPVQSSSMTSASAQGPMSVDEEFDEPVLEIEIRGSTSAPQPQPEPQPEPEPEQQPEQQPE